jgi:two-component system, NtrC family, nitrogen regulation response regulator NtrX
MSSVLIVDDEPNIRRMLTALLVAEGYEVRDAPDGVAAAAVAKETAPDVVLLDLMMPGPLDGVATLGRLREGDADLPVIMMSGRAGLSDAVRATKLGAFNFLEKPLSPETVLLAIAAALELRQARTAARSLREELGLGGPLVGSSDPMRRVRELMARVALSDSRVLIVGESGTGKELVAAAIHAGSPRRDRPFVRVNCAAIPRDLVESEMFGHERGAFTGAIERRIGRFELAHTGTLFLDEVGDLGPEAQAKLLRAIEAKEIERVGGNRPIRTDVRIVAATNKDLPRAVADGVFREDLYFRLAVIPIALPPLRDRATDIPSLVHHFTALHRGRTGRAVQGWTEGALDALTAYRWPGNVRELANIVERIAILHAGGIVTEADVQAVLPVGATAEPVWWRTDAASHARPAGPGTEPRAGGLADDLALNTDGAMPGDDGERGSETTRPRAPMADTPLADALDAYERRLITEALAASAGNVTEAARRLQTDRPNLYRRMRRLGVALGVLLACAFTAAMALAVSPQRAMAQPPDTAAQHRAPPDSAQLRAPPGQATQSAPRDSSSTAPSDTTARAREDTTPAEGDAWWQRWLAPTHPPTYAALSLTSAHTYNRVEGLPIYAGPTGRKTLPWGSISGEAYGIVRISDKLRWDDDHIGDAVHTQLTVNEGPNRTIAIGARVYDEIDPVESWQLSDAEVGLATLFLHRDYEDYFGRHGATAYVTVAANATTSLSLSYADERWSSRSDRDPFSIFRNSEGWRFNPDVDDGVFHIVGGHFVFDTRNDDYDPWSGWYITANLDDGAGVVTSFGPRTDGPTPLALPGGSGVQYLRGFLDTRRYNRVGPTEQLNFRLVVAGWLAGDQLPLEQRFSVGGAGTLPGFDFRSLGPGADVMTCSAGPGVPPGPPAECERIVLTQAEFRHDLRVGLADVVRGVPLDGAWIVFADAGRGWLVGAPDGMLTYRASTLPPLWTYRADAGVGIALGAFGFYVAQPVAPWAGNNGPRFVIRLQQRF